MRDEPEIGDVVAFLRGVSEVRETVAEVYGQKGRRQVVIASDQNTTGDMVDEPTTVSLPIKGVRWTVAT